MTHTLTFNPGPSKISVSTYEDIRDAIEQKIPEISHRSAQFTDISQQALEGIRELFGVPGNYYIVFTSSATEGMDLAIRSTVKETSFHLVQGNFSEKFASVSESLHKEALRDTVPWGKNNDVKNLSLPHKADLISMTLCETSTGVMGHREDIEILSQKRQKHQFLAVDITSIAGMYALDISQADMWLFSVQKGFGLPAGLGVMIVHERVVERALQLTRDRVHPHGAFGLSDLIAKIKGKYQTIATPNVLNIYLLAQQVARWNQNGGINKLEEATREKIAYLHQIVRDHKDLDFFVPEERDRSLSLCYIQGKSDVIKTLHERAHAENIILGKGYGPLKETCIRIANFPAITMEDLMQLEGILNPDFQD